jgi:hypothetical protein
MLAHTYRLRVMQRIRLLAFLTGLGALLNAFGPRLIATELPDAPVVGTERKDAASSAHVSVRVEDCRVVPDLEDRSA